MKAKYKGWCPRCKSPYPAGSEIIKIGERWEPVICKKCKQLETDRELIHQLEERMLSKHNIALGIFGIPEGAKGTSSRANFVYEAQELGAIMTDEMRACKRYWGDVWWWALDD